MPRAHQGSSSPHALVLAADREPWVRQPGEPNGSYARFQVFRECHPVVRKNMRRVFEMLREHGDDVATVATLSNMATLNLWHDRVAAYDEHRRQRAEEDERIAQQKWADQVAEVRAEVQIKQLEYAREMADIGMLVLRNRPPEDVNDAAAVRMVTEAFRIQRELLDLDNAHKTDESHPGHVDNLSREEAEARLADLVEEVSRRVASGRREPRTQHPTAAAALDVVDAEVISDGDPSESPLSRPGPAPEPDDERSGPDGRPAIGPAEPP